MTAYYNVFLAEGVNRAVLTLCQGMDEQEDRLERVRVKLGFQEDWSPSYDRTQAAPPRSDVSWTAKFCSINGPGDLNRVVGEMCAGFDIITEKWAEVEAHCFEEHSEVIPENLKRFSDPPRRGRPPKHA